MEYITRRISPPHNNDTSYEQIQIKCMKTVLEKEKKSDKKLIKLLLSLLIISSVTLLSLCVYILVEEGESSTDTQHNPNISNGSIIYIDRQSIELLFNNLYGHHKNSINFIKNNTNRSKENYIDFIFNDATYILPSLEFIDAFLKDDKTDIQQYILEKSDCDNFSFIVFGNFLKFQYSYNTTNTILFGVAYIISKDRSMTHTLNVFIDEYYRIYCIESQTDVNELCKDYKHKIYRVIF